jgi:hypothetical protein
VVELEASTMIGIDAICVIGCRANRETNASVSTSYRSFFTGKMIIDFALCAAALSNDFGMLRLQLQV